VWLTLLLTATRVQWLLIQMGRVPRPTQAQVHTFTTLTWGLLLLDALLGVAVLRGRWRQALLWSASSRHLDSVLAQLDQGGGAATRAASKDATEAGIPTSPSGTGGRRANCRKTPG
jgi:hypothetical protein